MGYNVVFSECVILNKDMQVLSTATHKKAFVNISNSINPKLWLYLLY